MAKITEIMSDMDKVENGTWVDYAAGISLCIANINNSAYRQERQKILRPFLGQRRSRNISIDEVLDLLKPAAASHLLLDWKNIEDEKGSPIPYSPEKALEFFNNPALGDLYNFVMNEAGENENFRKDILGDSIKN